MEAGTRISAEEYLRTSYDNPDREFRDGELEERSCPDYLHGKTQGMLFAFFLALQNRIALFPCVETRMRRRTNRYLIPDVAVFSPVEPADAVPGSPPLIVIEVLSTDHRQSQVRAKLQEYREWGVEHVWLADPHQK